MKTSELLFSLCVESLVSVEVVSGVAELVDLRS